MRERRWPRKSKTGRSENGIQKGRETAFLKVLRLPLIPRD